MGRKVRGREGQDRVLGKKGAEGLNRERKNKQVSKRRFVESRDTEVTRDA